MDLNNPQDITHPVDPLSPAILSLPIAVLGNLPACSRFHRSQDAAARAMESLVGRLAAASPGARR